MDDVQRALKAFDQSPTIQAVLLLAALYARYLVAVALEERKRKKAAKKKKGA